MTSNSPQSNVPLQNYSLKVIGGQTMTRSATLLLGAPPERTGAEARLHSWGRPCILPLLQDAILLHSTQAKRRSGQALFDQFARNSFHEIIWREDELSLRSLQVP